MSELDNPRALDIDEVAAAILDGTPVDWTQPLPEEPALLDELRVLAQIAAVHRSSLSDSMSTGLQTWGHLTLLECIGRGTSGEVFLAIDNRLQRSVAVKLLFPGAAPITSPTAAIEEACMLARVRHPNVVTVFGAEAIGERVGIITEHIDGRSLADVLRDQGPLGADEASATGMVICRALAAVHQAGLVHRDIKAQNVMREKGGRLVLMDIGAGHRLGGSAANLSGTPLYVAPEVLAGGPASARSDIYSLGALLFHLVTGAFPVSGESLQAIQAAHRAGVRTRLRELRPNLPAGFTSAVERALASDPAERFSSAADMEEALAAAIETSSPRLIPARGRTRGAALALAAVVAAAAGGAAWIAYTAGASTAAPAVAFQSREWVLLVPIENRTGDPSLDGVLEHALGHALSTSAHVNLVPDERVEDALRLMTRPLTTKLDARIAREIAIRDSNVRVLLAGSIARVGGTFPITLSVVDPATGETLASRREEPAGVAAIPAAIQEMSSWVRLSLGESARQVARSKESLQKVTTPSLSALRYFTAAMAAARRDQWNAAEPLFASAVEADPRFASAHIWRAWALRNVAKPADALASAQRALDLADSTTDRERHFLRGSAYLIFGEPHRAVGEFEALLALYPDDYWGQRKLFESYMRTRSRRDVHRLAVTNADARPLDPQSRLIAAQEVLLADGLAAARPHFARTRVLADAAGPDGLSPQLALFLRVFEVHDLWAQRRIADAERALNTLESDSTMASGVDWALNPAVTFRLSLGQPRAAERIAARMEGVGLRSLASAFIALARSEERAIPDLLRTYAFTDLSASSLLLRAGEVDAADRLLRAIPMPVARHFAWSAAEIDVARGTFGPQAGLLMEGIRFMRPNGGRSFLYAETLAAARVKAGDVTGAITLLEEQTAGADRVLSPTAHLGFLWMRSAKQLADLYRTVGRMDHARKIENDLLTALSHAEPDFPLLIELQSRRAR